VGEVLLRLEDGHGRRIGELGLRAEGGGGREDEEAERD